MNINHLIKEFSNFLNISYPSILEICHNIEIKDRDIFLADKIENGFLEFIWEILVESRLNKIIDTYGDGADFYGKSERVLYPEKEPDFTVIINVKNKIDLFSNKYIDDSNFDFIKLVSYNNELYTVKPPFDFVLCDDDFGKQYLFKLNEVDFILTEVMFQS